MRCHGIRVGQARPIRFKIIKRQKQKNIYYFSRNQNDVFENQVLAQRNTSF